MTSSNQSNAQQKLIASNLTLKTTYKLIFDQINLEIIPKTITFLLGKNGEGKTTLLNTLTGNITPTQGVITVNGQNLNELNQRATVLTLLEQHCEVHLPFTALEIIMIGRTPWRENNKTSEYYATEIIKQLKITHLSNRLYTTLSGGEKQLVRIARSLCQLRTNQHLKSARYLFLDEPLNFLDIKQKHFIMNFIKCYINLHNLGVIMVSHDLELATTYSNKVLIIEQGKMVMHSNTHSHNLIKIIKSVFGIYE